MRIVAGAWRGRALAAPPGQSTRPTSDRARQALFDRLMHAPWGGRARIEAAPVLDVFAGTGALGLEALSRGAPSATFIERDRAALATLRANIAALDATSRCRIVAADARKPPRGDPAGLVFLDPPYGQSLVAPAIAALHAAGWIAPDALLVIETATDEPLPHAGDPLATFTTGPARVTITPASALILPNGAASG